VTKPIIKASREFDYDLAVVKIRDSALPAADVGRPDDAILVDTGLGAALRTGTLVDLDSTMMISALGALLKHIQEHRTGIELEDSFTDVPIVSLRVKPLEKLMVMNNETFSSLQVFKKERHPSAVKTGGSKEGFSLYGTSMPLMCSRACRHVDGVRSPPSHPTATPPSHHITTPPTISTYRTLPSAHHPTAHHPTHCTAHPVRTTQPIVPHIPLFSRRGADGIVQESERRAAIERVALATEP
jgi:hypothetical protein